MPDGEVTVLKSQFEEFVKVQESGEVNMLDPVVRVLCCIDRAQHIYIMEPMMNCTKSIWRIEQMMCETCGNEFFGRKPVENKEGKKGVYCPYCKSFNEFQRKTKKKKQGGKR